MNAEAVKEATEEATEEAMSEAEVASPPARLKQRYMAEVRPQMLENLNLINIMTVPTLEKIVLNMGVGQATQQVKLLEGAQADMERITGQKPIVTKAKKSISNFRLREGNPIGVKVTLRGERTWEFFDRLVNFAIPRIRDFRGLSPKSFDGRTKHTQHLSLIHI